MGLKILNARILNEDTPEFFSELIEKGVDAVVEVKDLYSPCCLQSLCKFTQRKDNQYKCVKCRKVWVI
jgi:predicted transcriptional regulator